MFFLPSAAHLKARDRPEASRNTNKSRPLIRLVRTLGARKHTTWSGVSLTLRLGRATRQVKCDISVVFLSARQPRNGLPAGRPQGTDVGGLWERDAAGTNDAYFDGSFARMYAAR